MGHGKLIVQAIMIPIILCATGRIARAYRLVWATMAAQLVIFLCSIPFPSHSVFVGQGIDPRPFRYISASSYRFVTTFDRLRDGPGFVLDLHAAAGIITFPSVHAAMAALFLWGMWPVRLLRLPAIALNLLVMVSALACGAHYLCDVIAANVIVAAVLRVAQRPPVAWRGLARRLLPAPSRPAMLADAAQ